MVRVDSLALLIRLVAILALVLIFVVVDVEIAVDGVVVVAFVDGF